HTNTIQLNHPFFLLYEQDATSPVEITENKLINEFKLRNTIIYRACEIVDKLSQHHEM
ncbi:8149_t:CDS:1, partial [Dentiscutata erythropus]